MEKTTHEELMKKVEQKEFTKRCLAVLVCPECGEDIVNYNAHMRAKKIAIYMMYEGGYLCIQCNKLYYPHGWDDDMVDTFLNVWGAQGPDCMAVRGARGITICTMILASLGRGMMNQI